MKADVFLLGKYAISESKHEVGFRGRTGRQSSVGLPGCVSVSQMKPGPQEMGGAGFYQLFSALLL